MLQDDESLALALRGGLRGRFQGTFNQLENAVEVLDDYMLQHLKPCRVRRPAHHDARDQLAAGLPAPPG